MFWKVQPTGYVPPGVVITRDLGIQIAEEPIGDLLVNLAAGLVILISGVISGWILERIRRQRKLGHLRRLLPKERKVQIIVPAMNVHGYVRHNDGRSSRLPRNNPLMPMQESAAVARLALVIRRLSEKCSVDIVTADSYRDDYFLTVCFGGPAVNRTTGLFIPSQFPQLSYPHSVKKGTPDVLRFLDSEYTPSYDHEGQITSDYGYIVLYYQEDRSHVFLFGNWSHGTEMATKFLVSDAARVPLENLIRNRLRAVVVVHGEVRGLSNGAIRLVAVHAG